MYGLEHNVKTPKQALAQSSGVFERLPFRRRLPDHATFPPSQGWPSAQYITCIHIFIYVDSLHLPFGLLWSPAGFSYQNQREVCFAPRSAASARASALRPAPASGSWRSPAFAAPGWSSGRSARSEPGSTSLLMVLACKQLTVFGRPPVKMNRTKKLKNPKTCQEQRSQGSD